MPDLPVPVCRGVRGATTAASNTHEDILLATRALLEEIVTANDLNPQDVASIIFTMTPDLNAEHPSLAARQLGWIEVPLMCAQEIAKPDDLAKTIRVLIHWNTTRPQHEIRHIYINGAEVLRPDHASNGKSNTHGQAANAARVQSGAQS